MPFHGGLDRGGTAHAVCVVEAAGQVVARIEACHDARARGCKHPHVVGILARAWVRVLWHAWQDGTAYDPAKHKAAVRAA